MILTVVALAAAQPSAEALQLGRELAEAGTLSSLLTVMEAKEIDDLVAAQKDLPAADQASLRASAKKTFLAGKDRLLSATGRAYAERLTVEELRALVAFNRQPVAVKYRSVGPAVIAQTMQSVGEMDFKKDAIAAFCRESGKLCPPK